MGEGYELVQDYGAGEYERSLLYNDNTLALVTLNEDNQIIEISISALNRIDEFDRSVANFHIGDDFKLVTDRLGSANESSDNLHIYDFHPNSLVVTTKNDVITYISIEYGE